MKNKASKLKLAIRPFEKKDEHNLILLWKECGLVVPQNDPAQDIEAKLQVQPELFLVGELDLKIVGSIMGGYDGHRGWINYLAVATNFQRKGIARQLIEILEKKLLAMGCQKINLQVRSKNISVIEFYKRTGFKKDDVVSLGKRIIP
ncbi:GNAT family acetyltransferase [Desulfobacterales bacterium HSG16]|nr:GNAT family acetyltransferase [Desulfobacterales bacterium HSG16]